jgi:trans-aconitate methyltransferase
MRQLRQEAVDALTLPNAARVLEVGCGPGQITRRLVGRGARVHAVDSSPSMLAVARRAAPSASFEQVDARTFVPNGQFDVVLLSFILHELPPAELPAILGRLAAVLAPGGRLVIVDHSVPPGVAGRVWRVVLHLVESTAIDAWLALDLSAILADNGLIAAEDRARAGGRARMIVATRPADQFSNHN